MDREGQQTRAFYDQHGWRRDDGADRFRDTHIFGVREESAIRRELYQRQHHRIASALRLEARPIRLIECGCGATPAVSVLQKGDHYTGVDFSGAGLAGARESLQSWGGQFHLAQADLTCLPFTDSSFDALYSAHVLYHIANPANQSRALAELVRVLKPGGVAVLNLANPRPLLFPVRLGMRIAADLPLIGTAIDRVRKKGPLPYKPMPIGWYRKHLRPHGDVQIISADIPSTWFNQHVSEYAHLGAFLWRAIRRIDDLNPRLAAYLGNYFLMIFRKS